MCYGCRNVNDSESNKVFSEYNIDLNEYISFSNIVLGDLKSNLADNTNPSNTLK